MWFYKHSRLKHPKTKARIKSAFYAVCISGNLFESTHLASAFEALCTSSLNVVPFPLLNGACLFCSMFVGIGRLGSIPCISDVMRKDTRTFSESITLSPQQIIDAHAYHTRMNALVQKVHMSMCTHRGRTCKLLFYPSQLLLQPHHRADKS